ncbi:DHHW family protein [Paenibacillus sinopodophylli]|uniref:DHHW family protein n=1 Tax=Paenibacillus sinopodophylli TaxID=1837342 RepID=UPI001FE4A8DF|nr:DHHW family protein [Paenibacillus sinopodophylli]
MTDRIYVWGFVGLLFTMSVLFFLLPIQPFSNVENRTLQKAPQLTWDSLWSKTFSDESESFVTDHFPFRNQWVWTKSMLEQLRLQQENNGIYKGADGYLFEKLSVPVYEDIKAYTAAVQLYAQKHPNTNITFMLAPTSIGLYPERLPWLAQAYPQNEVNGFIGKQVQDSLNFIDGFDFLGSAASADRPIYYKTDHHWTTYGAYLAYFAYAQQMGWTPVAEKDFTIETITHSFLGSYHTRSQFIGLEPDSIEVYKDKNGIQTNMYIADTDQTVGSMYDPSYLAKKDKYSYFLGGVHALLTLHSTLPAERVELNKILVIKDSYAHSFLPFLTQHVQDIHVIDIRYYNGSISDYMAENGIEDVLMLFNTTTFIGERNLLKLNY